MSATTQKHLDTPMADAIRDLQRRILERFPEATFVVEEGSDPDGLFLVATVDIPDTDDVIDLVGDQLVAYQVEERLPIYVVPLRPIERVLAQLRATATPRG